MYYPQVGDIVKISRGGERFWVTVTKPGKEVVGTVDNELIFTDKHGLKLGDEVRFPRNQIVDVYAHKGEG